MGSGHRGSIARRLLGNGPGRGVSSAQINVVAWTRIALDEVKSSGTTGDERGRGGEEHTVARSPTASTQMARSATSPVKSPKRLEAIAVKCNRWFGRRCHSLVVAYHGDIGDLSGDSKARSFVD